MVAFASAASAKKKEKEMCSLENLVLKCKPGSYESDLGRVSFFFLKSSNMIPRLVFVLLVFNPDSWAVGQSQHISAGRPTGPIRAPRGASAGRPG